MEYYLVYKKEQEAPLLIGADNGFGVFWADQGFEALTNLISKSPSYLEDIEIRNAALGSLMILVGSFSQITNIFKIKKSGEYLKEAGEAISGR